MSAPHDIPSAAALVDAVRDFLERDVMSSTEGRARFHTRVAINVLGMVQRELELGEAQAAAHTEGLARLGFADEAALASAIRAGSIPAERMGEIAGFIRATVRDKLAVANPRYLDGPRRSEGGGQHGER